MTRVMEDIINNQRQLFGGITDSLVLDKFSMGNTFDNLRDFYSGLSLVLQKGIELRGNLFYTICRLVVYMNAGDEATGNR